MKSPIETMLRDALRNPPLGIRLADYTDGPAPDVLDMKTLEPNWSTRTKTAQAHSKELEMYSGDSDERYGEVSLYRGAPILSYRADLFLICERSALVIECDGHDFHDRTKQQAAYDRARDRDLLKLDIATARFTGSEIHHEPERCASDVWAIVFMMIRRSECRIRDWMMGADSTRNSRSVAPGEL